MMQPFDGFHVKCCRDSLQAVMSHNMLYPLVRVDMLERQLTLLVRRGRHVQTVCQLRIKRGIALIDRGASLSRTYPLAHRRVSYT